VNHDYKFTIVIDVRNQQTMMILFKKIFACLILAAVVFLCLVPMAGATAESFTVHASQEETKYLNIASEDHVQIRFVATGQAANTLDFYISDPQGDTIAYSYDTADFDYTFVCSNKGEYKMHFSNLAASEDTLVSLNYEIQHYIFGMPQMLFLTLIVVGLCVAAVAVFILMSKHP
jgi:multisubunit Na+/H+ antiporter MnhC subunit